MKFYKDIREFLDDICINYGFCLSPNDKKRISSRDIYEADKFVKEIFLIEGVDPDIEISLFRQVKNNFTDRFGGTLEE